MSDTEEIKSRLSIEEVVGTYVPLKKAGRILKANCPFHHEKTPSFTVSPERGIYKCFGCGEGGDIFDFVMKIEGLTFAETIKLLAERAGVELKDNPSQSTGPTRDEKERLRSLNDYVARLWHALLTKHPKAEPARSYLTGRGVTQESLTNFQIGYAPPGNGTGLALRKAGYTNADLLVAGDPSRFQQRIIFPISNITGQIVGFTGRLLGEGNGPKYWNTPETLLFNKSATLYALHMAKRAIQEEDVAILVEGQMDVVMLHQAGYPQSVASSGTALTAEQVKIISRFTHNIAFAYDQDKAGQEATKRGIEIVLAANLNPSVITIPNGKDPADCLLQAPELWEQAYTNRQPFMHWLLDHFLADDATLTPIRKKEVVSNLLPWLQKVTDPVEKQEWLRIIAGRLQTDENNLRQALQRLPGQKSSSTAPLTANRPTSLQWSEVIVALLLAFPALFPRVHTQFEGVAASTPFLELLLPLLQATDLKESFALQIQKKLSEQQQKEVSVYVQELLEQATYQEIDEVEAYTEILLIAQRLRSEAKEGQKQQLAQAIRSAQVTGDTAKLQALFSELKNLL